MEPKYEREFLEGMSADLEEYDKVFLALENGKLSEDLTEMLFHWENFGDKRQKILLLSSRKRETEPAFGVTYREIHEDEARKLRKLYFLYEFSDRFCVISEEKTFGGILHLVEAGLLSMKEVLTVLLG